MPTRYVAIKEEVSYAPVTPVVPDAAKSIDANRVEANLSEDHSFPLSMRGRGTYSVNEGYLSENVTMQIDCRPDNVGWFNSIC